MMGSEQGHSIFKIKTRYIYFSIVLIWIVLAVIFAVYDLLISNSIASSENLIGKITAQFGEVPGYLLINFSLFTLYATNQWKISEKKLLMGLVVTVFTILSTLSIEKLIRFLNFEEIVPAVLGILCSVYVFAFIDETEIDLKQYIEPAKITVKLAILNPLIFVQTFKSMWGRVRYRDLSASQVEFTPFYIPNGPGWFENRSFPSGHAAMGWIFLSLFLFFDDRIIKRFLFAISVCWGIVVAVGRVLIGAHYASDVLFSSMMGIMLFVYLTRDYEPNEL